MTKNEILEYFKDINHAYNDCTRYDTLKRMIDELQEPCEDAIKYFNTIYELSQTMGVSYDFIDEKIKEAEKIVKALPQEPCENVPDNNVGEMSASLTGEDSTCDDCINPCVVYEKGMRGCISPTGAEGGEDV